MLDIHIVRHGVTDYNLQGRVQGPLNHPLNGEGRAQAAEAAEILGNAFPVPEAVFSSSLARARETAAIIQRRFDIPLITSSLLREISQGAWNGQSHADLRKIYPEERKLWEEKPWEFTPPGGESILDVQKRLTIFLEGILLHDFHGAIIIVTHEIAGAVLATMLRQLPVQKMSDFYQKNGGVMKIQFDGSI